MKAKLAAISCVTLLLSACAAIPPGSDYISCAGGGNYTVCKKIKVCGPDESVLIEDHFFDGKLHKSVEQPCAGE
jgi:hypothetical protein